MVDPDDLLVGGRLGAGEGGVEGPGGAVVGRLVGPHVEHRLPLELMPIVVDQAVPSEVHSTVGSEWKESPGLPRQARLAPGGAAVGRVELRLAAAARDVVRGADDLHRIPVVDADVRFAARRGLDARDPLLAGDHGRLDRRRDRVVLLGRRLLVRRAGHEALVRHHPLVDLLEHERIAARGVRRRVVPLGVRLAPDHPQPERHGDLVVSLLGPQQREVLMGGDQGLEGAMGSHGVGPELLGERGPTGGRARRGQGYRGKKDREEQKEADRSLFHNLSADKRASPVRSLQKESIRGQAEPGRVRRPGAMRKR